MEEKEKPEGGILDGDGSPVDPEEHRKMMKRDGIDVDTEAEIKKLQRQIRADQIRLAAKRRKDKIKAGR